MARRILSADSALMPQAQPALASSSVRTEFRGGFLQWLQDRWTTVLGLRPDELLFDWQERGALMNEIEFVNETREKLDEAALKIAPSMLRIVLTVQANLPDRREQRAFLAEHVAWDLRRISELCIVAESYGLLDAARRELGAAEIAAYGWSSALKLAYVRDPAERQGIWERARGDKPHASYRAVLEEMRRFRERKLVGPPASQDDVDTRLEAARRSLAQLEARPASGGPERYRELLGQVTTAQRELSRLKRALQERLQADETEQLAENV